MEINCNYNEEHQRVLKTIESKEKLESKAIATLTTETLNKLNISIENLQQKCQNLLQQLSDVQMLLQIESRDPITLSLIRDKELTEKIMDEYEILKLQQKNAELQVKINRNKKFTDNLKMELKYSKTSLANQIPNPENILDNIRQLKQKLVSYEDNYEKAKAKYQILSLPDNILPKAIASQVTTLLALKEEEDILKQRAKDFAIVEETRKVFNSLRK